MYLYSVVVYLLLGGKNLDAGAAGEGVKLQKGPRGFLPLFAPQEAVLYNLLNPSLPVYLLIIITILLLLLLILLLLLLLQEVCKPSRPSLLLGIRRL